MSGEQDDLPAEHLGTRLPPPGPLRPRPERPPRRRHSRGRYRARRAFALLVLVVLGFGAWFAIELFQPFAGSGSGSVTVTIPKGYSARQIGDLLAQRGVVASGFFFRLRVSLDGDPTLRDGKMHLRRDMSYSAALHVLTTRTPPSRRPAPLTTRLTIPEGFTRLQIAVLAHPHGLSGSYVEASSSARGFRLRAYGAPRHVRDLEGFLFPATYSVTRGEPASTLVGQQLLAFRQNFDAIDFARARAAGLSRYDVLIIASMIEREAQVPGDRGLVAAVIYNRLKAGMTLGIDATLRYWLNDYTHPLTESQLGLDTPYNTRLHRGLPPTPISNPGLASMIAAANPAHVPYLYYVDKPYTCGKLAFATTAAQFDALSAAYNRARDANGGRAPTRCP